jgi:hypothetical protein
MPDLDLRKYRGEAFDARWKQEKNLEICAKLSATQAT